MAASMSRGNSHKYSSESKTDWGEIKKCVFLVWFGQCFPLGNVAGPW